MKLKLFGLLLILAALFVSACVTDVCDEHKTIFKPLYKNHSQLISYKENQKISFTHSSGSSVDFLVTQSNIDTINVFDWCNTILQEQKIAILESEDGYFDIEINVSSYDEDEASLTFVIGNEYFFYNHLEDYLVDSLEINDTTFTDVFSDTLVNNNLTDTTIIVPKIVVYNKELGVVHIEMVNHETYTLNN